jgi:hypothetical protein
MMSTDQILALITETENKMKKAAKELDFITAAQYRDEVFKPKKKLKGGLMSKSIKYMFLPLWIVGFSLFIVVTSEARPPIKNKNDQKMCLFFRFGIDIRDVRACLYS